MRKFLAVSIVVFMLVGVLAACGGKTTSDASASGESSLKDGVYKVAFDNFDSHDWKAQVELEIKDSKIANVKFDYVNKEGKLKSQDAEYKKSMESKSGTYPEKYIKELQDQLIQKQDIAAVDAVTGATSSSNNFKELVKYALDEMAKKGVTGEKTIPLPKEE